MKIVLVIITIIFSVLVARFFILGQKSQEMQVKLGITNENKLNSCLGLQNCVSSFESTDPQLQKLKINSNPIPKLKESAQKNGLRIVESNDLYLYLNHQSTLFGFIDDVEFLYLPETHELHFRSASRVGKSDFGANKKRILKFLSELN